MAERPVVSAVDVRVTFAAARAGRRRSVDALAGVDLEIHEGEAVGIIGDSGAGKSTLAMVLAGLLTPTAGHVSVDGIDLARATQRELREARRHVGIVFQDALGSFNPMRTVEHSLAVPLGHFSDLHGRPARRAIGDMMERVGLHAAQTTRYPHEFSGGQIQRLAIARALITRPRVVVLDEPVSALDVSIRAQVLNLLQDLAAEFRLTYVLIATDPSVVEHVTSRAVVLYAGRVLEAGPRPLVFEAPAHPYTVSLLSLTAGDGPRDGRAGLIASRATDLEPSAAVGCPFSGICPIELPVCGSVQPPLVPADPDHLVRCHAFADGGAR